MTHRAPDKRYRGDHPMFDYSEETPEQELERLRGQDVLNKTRIRLLLKEIDRFKVPCKMCSAEFVPDDFTFAERTECCSDECTELERRLNEADCLGDEIIHGDR